MSAYYNIGPYGVGHYSKGFVYNLGGALPIAFGFLATTSNPVDIAGNLAVSFAFGGGVNCIFPVRGDLPITPVLAGGLAALYPLQGDLPFHVAINVADAQITVQPLWNETVPCPPSIWGPSIPADTPWAPSEVCNG